MLILHSYKTDNFKIFPFLLHGYHTPQPKNIAFLAIAFSSHNFKILPTSYMEFFWVVILLNFFGKQLEAVSNIITIISKITELVSHNIASHSYIPISHGVNKKSPPIVSPGPLPYQVLIRFFNLQEIFYQLFFALIRLP